MTKPRNPPKRPPNITIRRELRKGMVAPDYRVMCGAEKCEYVDKSDEMGAQRLARKHNNDRHGGACIIRFENMEHDRMRVRALEHTED